MDIAKIFTLIGGLGLFFYGMQLMNSSIERAAGARLRNILEAITKNQFMGFLVGLIVTAVIQSSGATTVMVVSFVNSGLMSLYQAAGIILGANVGTTVTSQLVAFDLDTVAPLILFVGVILAMFVKNQKVKKVGDIILGFGILFVGLSIMKESMSTLQDVPAVVNFLKSLSNPILAVLFGFVVTALDQSSSVTVSIILLLASQRLVDLQMCFFAILGCNIGSCTTALLASMSGKRDAKRAALIHFLINVFGTIVIALVLLVARDGIETLLLKLSPGNIGRAVANAHTSFKVFQVIIMFPFTKLIVKMTYLLVPGNEKEEETFQLQYIGKDSVFSPTTAVVEAIKELERMGEIACANLNRAMNSLILLDDEMIEEVYVTEEHVDMMNHAITDYLVKLNQMQLPVDDEKSIGALFHVVNDIERIGDHAENVADAARQRQEENISFSKECIREMGVMMDMVNDITRYAIEMFSKNTQEHLQDIIDLENQIDEKEKEYQRNHVHRLTRNECTAEAGMIYSDVISGLERVADHATNIAYSILEEDPETDED